MCPARIAVPVVAPGFAPYRHQPTLAGFGGTSSSRSAVVPTFRIGALALSFGMSIRFGETISATGLGLLAVDGGVGCGATVVGIVPTLRTVACGVSSYGDVTQVMPATPIVMNAAIRQATGTQPVRSRAASRRASSRRSPRR